MKILLTIVIVVVLQQTVTALNCYFCIGSVTGDCAQGKQSAMVKIPCGMSTIHSHSKSFNDIDVQLLDKKDDDLKASCVKFVEPLPGDAKGLVRGCAVLPESFDPCKYIIQHLNGTNCKSCTTPLCNNSPLLFNI